MKWGQGPVQRQEPVRCRQIKFHLSRSSFLQLAINRFNEIPESPQPMPETLDTSFRLKKRSSPILPYLNALSKHNFHSSSMLSIINTIKIEFLIRLFLYSIIDASFHLHFYFHLISSNVSLPILYSQMNMAFCKLQLSLPVKILEKESLLSNAMIVSQGCKG